MRPIRVLIAKPGLDGHDRGAKVVAAALRDAGMEVIYTGLHQTPEMIANAAVQEDVDVIGLSILSGAHMTLFPRVLDLLREAGRDDVLITGGGIIPKEDMEELQRRGTGKLFGPGTSTSDLVDYIRDWFEEREGASSKTRCVKAGVPTGSRSSTSRASSPRANGSPNCAMRRRGSSRWAFSSRTISTTARRRAPVSSRASAPSTGERS
jgi:methylmalonyl-CoA mutase, C-terminal domain